MAMGQPVCLVELSFICQAFDKEASTTNMKSFGRLGQASNSRPKRHRATGGGAKHLKNIAISFWKKLGNKD